MVKTKDKVKIKISQYADIAEAALKARLLATTVGFQRSEAYAIGVAVSELATNIYKYAKRGEIIITPIIKKTKNGIEVIARDNGPGIRDIEKALSNGFSTSKTLGVGLPAVKRLMDEFVVSTEYQKGTKITVKKWVK